MGQFKPMTKMMTTEPSVILKLKKGGHVNRKDNEAGEFGHEPMRKGPGLTVAIAVGKPRGGGPMGASPKKPSVADRRKAMAAPMMKNGGKVVKKMDGGVMGAPGAMPAMAPRAAPMVAPRVMPRAPMGAAPAAMAAPVVARPGMAPAMAPGLAPRMAMKKGGSTDMAQDKAMIKKAMGQHDAQEHPGGKGTKLALKGGTIGGNAGKFLNTKVNDGDKNDSAKGTGGVRNSNSGGYKAGGTIKGNAGKFLANMSDGDKHDSAKGTGGVKMANDGGYKDGGSVDWANRPADTSKPGPTGTSTSGVRNSNAGGYKMGGSAKKAFATGGSVDTGHPVAYPSKPASKPVSNTAQSGTFKHGGKVSRKADGGSMGASPRAIPPVTEDRSAGAYDKAIGPSPEDMSMAESIRSAPGRAYDAMKRLLGRAPEAGAGRGFVNPPMARKAGGAAKC